MFNRTYQLRARKMGPLPMESAGQILGRLALTTLASSARRRARAEKKKPEGPEQLDLFAAQPMNQIETAAPEPADRPLTEEELWQLFNRLFPENPCPR